MTSDPTVWVLDVGHGSATVVEQPGRVSIIDGGRGDALLLFLEERDIRAIDVVILSHVDADHLGGISLLLLDEQFHVGRVHLNPDARSTALWRDFMAIMRDARARGTQFSLELTSVNPGTIEADGIRLEILAPSQELASRTPSGFDERGRHLNPNAMSAVVRIWHDQEPEVLVTGDIDSIGLEHLADTAASTTSFLRARVLVFPHHGGLPGRGDASAFAAALTSAVMPEVVIFSTGRGVHGTPRPEIVGAVLQHAPSVRVACTQLSERCAIDFPATSDDHLHPAHARGKRDGACCAGTLEIPLDRTGTLAPSRDVHLEFIDRSAPTALCRGCGG